MRDMFGDIYLSRNQRDSMILKIATIQIWG